MRNNLEDAWTYLPGRRLLACVGQNRCAKKNDADAFAENLTMTTTTMASTVIRLPSGTSMVAAIARCSGPYSRQKARIWSRRSKGWIIRNATRGVVLLESRLCLR